MKTVSGRHRGGASSSGAQRQSIRALATGSTTYAVLALDVALLALEPFRCVPVCPCRAPEKGYRPRKGWAGCGKRLLGGDGEETSEEKRVWESLIH